MSGVTRLQRAPSLLAEGLRTQPVCPAAHCALTVLCAHCVSSALPAQHTVSLDKAQDTRYTGFPGPPGEGTVLYTTPAIIFFWGGGRWRQGLKTTLFEWLAEVWGIVVVFLQFSNLLQELTELSKGLHVGL